MSPKPPCKGGYPVVGNVTAGPCRSRRELAGELVTVTLPVQWEQSIRICWIGVRVFVEVGPGQVLAGWSTALIERRVYSWNPRRRNKLLDSQKGDVVI